MNEEPTGLLSISALRFFGDCGVLIPEHIDYVTGYRYYSRDQLSVAELVRHLRAVEMPIADIQSFLTSTPAAAEVLLDQHWTRLQGRIERNRRALDAVQSLLRSKETSMSATTSLSGARLASAIRQVLPAAGELPHHDCQAAVLVELREDGAGLLRLTVTGWLFAICHRSQRARAEWLLGRPMRSKSPLSSRLPTR